jgi:ankyrin repeat protein
VGKLLCRECAPVRAEVSSYSRKEKTLDNITKGPMDRNVSFDQFCQACRSGNLNAVRSYIETASLDEVDAVDEYAGVSGLMWAAGCRQPAVVKLLLEAGARPEAADHHGWTSLHWAMSKDMPSAFEVIQLLLQARQSLVNTQDSSGQAPAYYAVSFGLPHSLDMLLRCACLDAWKIKEGSSLDDLISEAKGECKSILVGYQVCALLCRQHSRLIVKPVS